ncbi:hypothetical protein PTT_10857 [Pyrenophora teres f. teres 0-1]|uniref:Uncharacterized protein n=1 Tax=Pyrenophora teres f. teres (strain 0-1) TaxID=861557 RepID=E3RQ85_PYRTT|nr:hypothetical protein PTT_10857 [Pyrenophora teres f. teres 0-1]
MSTNPTTRCMLSASTSAQHSQNAEDAVYSNRLDSLTYHRNRLLRIRQARAEKGCICKCQDIDTEHDDENGEEDLARLALWEEDPALHRVPHNSPSPSPRPYPEPGWEDYITGEDDKDAYLGLMGPLALCVVDSREIYRSRRNTGDSANSWFGWKKGKGMGKGERRGLVKRVFGIVFRRREKGGDRKGWL